MGGLGELKGTIVLLAVFVVAGVDCHFDEKLAKFLVHFWFVPLQKIYFVNF